MGAAAKAAVGLLTQNGINPNDANPGLLHGLNSQTGTQPDIQLSLLSGALGFISHPIFQKILGNVINGVLPQHSLDPTGATAPFGAQQGLAPHFGTYAPQPTFQHIDAALSQYGLNPTAQYTDIQHGFWSSVGDFFKNPITQKVISTAADVAIGVFLGLNPNDAPVTLGAADPFTQHGLYPARTFPPPFVQQGLFTDFLGTLI